jgi:GT2 family glycosyltransferase
MYHLFTAAIISFNVKEKLQSCIESIKQYFPSVPICVWDNGSSDGSQEMVKSLFPEVCYFYSPENLYFSRGCNELIARCQTKYALLMNADIKLLDRSVADIVDYMELDSKLIAVSPSVQDHGLLRHMSSGIITPFICIARDSIWGKVLRKQNRYRESMGDDVDPHSVFENKKITNCCCMIRCKTFTEIGGFSTRQILYWSEEVFAVMIQKHGLKQAVFGKCIVEHDHGSSTKKLNPQIVRAIYMHDRLQYMCSIFGFTKSIMVEIALLRPKLWISMKEYFWLLKFRGEINQIKKDIKECQVDI